MSETNDLALDEGLRLFVYDDKTGQVLGPGDKIIGHPTIGIGRNIGREGEGLRSSEVAEMLEADISSINSSLSKVFSWWSSLDKVRADVVSEMVFNMGLHGFMNFHFTISSIANGKFAEAALEMLDSNAARSAPIRYERLSRMMKTGQRGK